MVCTVRFNSHSGAPNYKTFSDIPEAEEFIDKLSSDPKFVYNANILVDYSEVRIYKEKFEELYAEMKDFFLKGIQPKSKTVI